MARLFDRSGWSQKQRAFTIASKLCALVCLALITLTPLKVGSLVFIIGATLIALGLIGLVKAVFDFKNTPLDESVTRGLYRISRHPQIVMASVVLLGACIAIGSWSALVLLTIAKLFGPFGNCGGRGDLPEAVQRCLSRLFEAGASIFCIFIMGIE